jgi:hypothetical protein
VRGNGRAIYLVQNSTARMIPDMDTFLALNLDLEKVIHVNDMEFLMINKGPDIPSTNAH